MEGDDSDLVSDFLKNFVALQVSTMPPININKTNDEDNIRNGDAGGFNGTSNESPPSLQASEVLSDDQEEACESRGIVTRPPPGTSRTELSPPN